MPTNPVVFPSAFFFCLATFPYSHQALPEPGWNQASCLQQAGFKLQNLKSRFYAGGYFNGRKTGRTFSLDNLITITHKTEPETIPAKARCHPVNKLCPPRFASCGVKTPPVKDKSEWGVINRAAEKIVRQKSAVHSSFNGPLFCDGNSAGGDVHSSDLKPMLGQPDGIGTCSTTNLQHVSGKLRPTGHHAHQVRIRMPGIPGQIILLVTLIPLFFISQKIAQATVILSGMEWRLFPC